MSFIKTQAGLDRIFEVQDAHAALRRKLYTLEEDPKDPLNPARIRGIVRQMKVLDSTEGDWRMLSASQVALLLEIMPEVVELQRVGNRLLALDFHTGGEIWLYPAGQFTYEGALPGLEAVLAAMPSLPPFGKAQILLNQHSLLGGKSIAQYLREGGELAHAIQIADLFDDPL